MQKACQVNIKIYLNFCSLALKFPIFFLFLSLYTSILLKIVKVRGSLISENLWKSIPYLFTSENFITLEKAQMCKFKWPLLCEASLNIYYSSFLIHQHFACNSAFYDIQPVITNEWYLHVYTPQSGCSKWLTVPCLYLHPSWLLVSGQWKQYKLNLIETPNSYKDC